MITVLGTRQVIMPLETYIELLETKLKVLKQKQKDDIDTDYGIDIIEQELLTLYSKVNDKS